MPAANIPPRKPAWSVSYCRASTWVPAFTTGASSTIANFWLGCALAAVAVAASIKKPTVTMIPQPLVMKLLIFGA